MTVEELLRLIPHRPPFLFMDDVLESDDDHLVTVHRPKPDAVYFKGHFPGCPVMPGVLLCECCFQAGAALLFQRSGAPQPRAGTAVVTRIREAKFKRIVRPGDELRIAVTLDDLVGDAYWMTGRITVDGAVALRLAFACAVTAVEELGGT